MKIRGQRLDLVIASVLFVFTALVMTNCGSLDGGGGDGNGNDVKNSIQKPNPPANVTASAGDEEVTVSWDDVSDAQSYNIYWTTDPTVPPNKSIIGATSPHIHTGLTNGTTYYYAVTAVNGGGESNISSVVSATPQAPLPGVPSNVTITAGIRQVTISWDPVDRADTYNIYWKTDSGVSTADNLIDNVSSPYVHTGISNGTTYYYAVTAVNQTGEGDLSSEVSAMPTFGNVVLKKLLASDGEGSDWFGYSVAIDGDYAIVGAYREDEGGADAGAAYIFHRTTSGSWDSVTKIMAPDSDDFDFFGKSVAISGDYAIVGAFEDDEKGSNAGAAYIFHRTDINTWDEVKKIMASDAEDNDQFGWSVAISGDYAIVGADQEDGGPGSSKPNAGAAYIFHRTNVNTWDEVKKVTAHDADVDDRFGWSIAISGDYAIVGAYKEDGGPGSPKTDAGAAYIFYSTPAGNWDNDIKIMAPLAEAFDYFGNSVAISGDYVIIGAHDRQVQGPFSGAAFIFHRTGENAWDDVKEIKALDPDVNDHFGYSVAISGDYAIVGAQFEDEGAGDAGAAYIFRRISGNSWDNGIKIMASDPGLSDLFGFSVAISGDFVIVGAYGKDDISWADEGAAYLY